MTGISQSLKIQERVSGVAVKVSACSLIAAAAMPLCTKLPEPIKKHLPPGLQNPSSEVVAENILAQAKMGAYFLAWNLAAAHLPSAFRRRKADNQH